MRHRAALQHGVVTRSQMLSDGLSADAVDRRVRAGLLVRVHAGVYRFGPVAAVHWREMAALLACGPHAILASITAAEYWHIVQPITATVPIHLILCSGQGGRRRVGIRVRRIATLSGAEITVRDGMKLTTPTRTLLDLCSIMSGRQLEKAVAEAFALRLVTRYRLQRLLQAHPHARGRRRLRALLEAPSLARTRSEAEERFLMLVRAAALPEPETNVRLSGYQVDFLWRKQRLVVEVDGFAFHGGNRAFERDRKRDAVLAATGMRVIRVTWRHMTEEYDSLIRTLAAALAVT